jgi:PAS domain S-box-containing protein
MRLTDATARPTESVEGAEEDRFRLLADSMPQLVWTADDDGVVDYYNARFREYGGLTQRADGSYDWALIVHPEDLDATVSAWAAAVKEAAPYTCEHRVRMADGGWRWHVSRATPIRDASGRVTKWYGTATDIDQLKQVEETLRISEARLRLALEAGGMGDWAWDVEAGRVSLSPRAREIYGVDADVIGLRALRDQIALEDADEVRSRMEAALRTGGEFAAEYAMTRPDGARRWVSARALPNQPGGERRLVGVVQDITERREAEAHRALLLAELQHRVKNMLAVVQGVARQSFRAGIDPAIARTDFEKRLGAMARAHDLLTKENWSDVDLGELLHEQLDMMRDRARFDASGPPVRLSPRVAVNLGMALHELATNASKYGALSIDQGRIDVVWTVNAARLVELNWTERNGPTVSPPNRRGFGSRMIVSAVETEMGGEARFDYAPEGFRCRLKFPAEVAAA